jgi:hypothetical protein
MKISNKEETIILDICAMSENPRDARRKIIELLNYRKIRVKSSFKKALENI